VTIRRRAPSRLVSLVMGVGAFVFGLALLALSYVLIGDELALRRDGVSTTAVIAGKHQGYDSESGYSYGLSYRFTAPDGREYAGRVQVPYERYERAAAGDPIEIVYVRDDPAVNREPGRGMLPVLLLVPLFGLIGLGMSAAILGFRLPLGQGGPGHVTDVVGPDGTLWTAYRRPLGKMLGQILGGLVGTAIGLVALVAGLLGFPPLILIGLLFSVLLVPAAVLGLWRLWREPDSPRIGPLGLWLPMVGAVPWGEIESIRVEDAATAGPTHAGEGRPVNQALRLGIGLRPGSTVRGRTVVDRLYMAIGSLSRSMRPLGVYEQELPVPLEEVVARIERHHPVDRTVWEGGGPPLVADGTPAKADTPL